MLTNLLIIKEENDNHWYGEIFKLFKIYVGVMWCLSLSPHSKEGSGFERRPFCAEFTCSLHACLVSLGYAGFLLQPEDMQIRLTGYAK